MAGFARDSAWRTWLTPAPQRREPLVLQALAVFRAPDGANAD